MVGCGSILQGLPCEERTIPRPFVSATERIVISQVASHEIPFVLVDEKRLAGAGMGIDLDEEEFVGFLELMDLGCQSFVDRRIHFDHRGGGCGCAITSSRSSIFYFFLLRLRRT